MWYSVRRYWLRKAVDTGHPDQAPAAMVGLGFLEDEQGNPDEARQWFSKAVDTGHPDQAPAAMVGLGFLEQQQGNLDEAERWFRAAVDTGHPDMAPAAMSGLGFLEGEGDGSPPADAVRRVQIAPDLDLDPVVFALIKRLPPRGGWMTEGEIDRWLDAARAALRLAHADNEAPDPRGPEPDER